MKKLIYMVLSVIVIGIAARDAKAQRHQNRSYQPYNNNQNYRVPPPPPPPPPRRESHDGQQYRSDDRRYNANYRNDNNHWGDGRHNGNYPPPRPLPVIVQKQSYDNNYYRTGSCYGGHQQVLYDYKPWDHSYSIPHQDRLGRVYYADTNNGQYYYHNQQGSRTYFTFIVEIPVPVTTTRTYYY